MNVKEKVIDGITVIQAHCQTQSALLVVVAKTKAEEGPCVNPTYGVSLKS